MNHRSTVARMLVAAAWVFVGCVAPAPGLELTPTTTVEVRCRGLGQVDGGCESFGWRRCEPPFMAGPDGVCVPIVAAECPLGTMATLGESECSPVGWVSCPSGFERPDASAGCLPVLPSAPCVGATREALGQTSCVPIGDCGAAFPPPGATLFVDDDAGVLDATHFRTVTAALAAATPGAVIAVEAGTYREGVWPLAPVTVIGRCPERVRFVGTGLNVPGVYSVGVPGVVVRGVTLSGHFQGARVQGGGSLVLEDAVVESARLAGLIAWQSGSTLTARRVAVRDTRRVVPNAGMGVNADEGGEVLVEDAVIAGSQDVGAGTSGSATPASQLTLVRSVIRDTNAARELGTGVGVQALEGTATLSRCAVLTNTRVGLGADGARARLDAVEVSVEQTTGARDEYPAGISATNGAHVSLTRVTSSANDDFNVISQGAGAEVRAVESTLQFGRPNSAGEFGIGAAAYYGGVVVLSQCDLAFNSYYGLTAEVGAAASMEGCLVRDTAPGRSGGLGRGVNIDEGSSLDATHLTLERNTDESLLVRANEGLVSSVANVQGLLVRSTQRRASGSSGIGVSVNHGARLVLTNAAMVSTAEVALFINDWLTDAGVIAHATVSNCVIQDTRPNLDGTAGAGVVNGGVLELENAAVLRSSSFGVGSANPLSRLTARHVTVDGVRDVPGDLDGLGVFSTNHGLASFAFTEVSHAKVGFAFDNSGASLTACAITHNRVGLHVQHQSVLVAVDQTPSSPMVPLVTIDRDTLFEGNDTRQGNGVVPLPLDLFADAGS